MDIEPLYMGRESKDLFGIYHAPLERSKRGCVLCYPFGQEYMRAHRTFLHLAIRLANAGFHCLRFDYRGSGDSAGEGGSSSEWIEDIRTAATELRQGADVSTMTLVGLRFGATLAALASEGLATEALILWDPVVNGARYVDELEEQHQSWLHGSFAKERPLPARSEFLGFELTSEQKACMQALDLTRATTAPANKVLVLETLRKTIPHPLSDPYQRLGVRIDQDFVACPSAWTKPVDLGTTLVAGRPVERVVTWLCDVCQ